MNTFESFVVNYIHVIGWASFMSFLAFAWKLSVKWNKNHEAGQKAMQQIDEWSTNHMPHIQQGIEDLNKKTEEGNKTLSQMATNIAILKDRGTRL